MAEEEKNVKKICQEIQKAAMATNKAAASLPTTEDFSYYNSFPEYSSLMNSCRDKINGLMNQVAKNYKCKTIKPLNKAKGEGEKFEVVGDLNDLLLDRASNWMDEAEGLKKRDSELVIATLSASVRAEDTKKETESKEKPDDKMYQLLAAKVVRRPQVDFEDKPNNDTTPFVPRLTEKPNSLKPLAILPETLACGRVTYCHPYEFEIEKLEPSEEMLSKVEPQSPRPLKDTPFTVIETQEQLVSMINELRQCKELAIDLEHHSFRSYQGFTCTIQMSSRSADFLIDALKLRSQLHLLNELFTNSNIVKVLHGADMDILWLQRDFGLYIVNMFDTGQASRVLGLAHHSLAHLLKTYCHIDADKQFQLADWRIRPLPQQLLDYARSDTHYLLYIYDLMRNQLIDRGNENKNLIRSVYSRSSSICLKKYEKPIIDESSYLNLISRNRLPFNARQLHALEQLYTWRDKLARTEDESTGFVLPNHMLIQLAHLLPREVQGIIAACNPVPPLVKQNLHELYAIIYKAREIPLEQKDHLRLTSQSANLLKKPIDSFARHDECDMENFVCLLNEGSPMVIEEQQSGHGDENLSPLAKCFPERYPRKPATIVNFVSPYQRMLKALKNPVKMEKEEKKEEEQEEDPLSLSRLKPDPQVLEEFLSPIKKMRIETKVNDDPVAPPMATHDYKTQVANLFTQDSSSQKKKFFDPHGEYMKDSKRGRGQSKRNRR